MSRTQKKQMVNCNFFELPIPPYLTMTTLVQLCAIPCWRTCFSSIFFFYIVLLSSLLVNVRENQWIYFSLIADFLFHRLSMCPRKELESIHEVTIFRYLNLSYWSFVCLCSNGKTTCSFLQNLRLIYHY